MDIVSLSRNLFEMITINLRFSIVLTALTEACQRRDLDSLKKAITRAKEANFDHQLDLQLALANRLKDQLERIEKLRHSVLNLDTKTIAEDFRNQDVLQSTRWGPPVYDGYLYSIGQYTERSEGKMKATRTIIIVIFQLNEF